LVHKHIPDKEPLHQLCPLGFQLQDHLLPLNLLWNIQNRPEWTVDFRLFALKIPLHIEVPLLAPPSNEMLLYVLKEGCTRRKFEATRKILELHTIAKVHQDAFNFFKDCVFVEQMHRIWSKRHAQGHPGRTNTFMIQGLDGESTSPEAQAHCLFLWRREGDIAERLNAICVC